MNNCPAPSSETPVAPAPTNTPVSSRNFERLALLALFAGAVGIAFSPIFVRLADVAPTVSAFYRTALAVPLLFGMPLLAPGSAGGSAIPKGARELSLFLLAGLFFAGDLGLWHISLGLTSVANATLFPNLAPIFVTFGAWWLFGERITLRFLAGLVIAIIGAITVLGDSLRGHEGHISGDLLALSAALFYAGYLLVVSRLRRRYTTLTLMAWSTLCTALILLPISLLSGHQMAPAALTGWLVLFGLSWISHAGGQGLIAFALAHLPVSFSSVGLLLQPALAALFAYLLLGEDLDPLQLVGGIIILIGIYLARRATKR